MLKRRDVAASLGGMMIMLALPPRAHAAPVDTGAWSSVYNLPSVAIHVNVLPNGNVLFYQDAGNPKGTPSGDTTIAHVMTVPPDGAPTNFIPVPNKTTNLFCAGHSFLPDGRLLLIGGQKEDYYHGTSTAILFSWAGGYSWRNGPSMRAPRWYPTAITLRNGEVLALAGTTVSSGEKNKIPEVWKTTGGWRALTTASRVLPPYAWVFQAPNGKVFMAGSQATAWLDTAGTGRWTAGPARIQADRSRGTAVMYAPGKILMVGGGSNTAETIDLNVASPAWKATGSLAEPGRLRFHHATVLPDGTVLVTGGGDTQSDASKAVKTAELWDPATGMWTKLSAAAVPRLYHSVGFLLPDGRVMAAGGGRSGDAVDQRNAEIFSPPYLFKGSRPVISSAPGAIYYGKTFQVGTSDAANINKVSLVRLSSVTHTFNANQRFVPLTFAKGSSTLTVTAPASGNIAPPGHYMFFILKDGVPSISKIIQLL